MCEEETCDKCWNNRREPVEMNEVDSFPFASKWKCPRCGYTFWEYFGDHFSCFELDESNTHIIKIHHFYQEAPLLGGL